MKKLSLVLVAILAIVLMGCSKDKKVKLITLSTSSTTMHHGDTYQITAQCDDAISYTSNNEYHASVTNQGLITANYVGNTTIKLSSNEDTKTFNVTVAAESNLYPEPNISFGESKSSVISKLGTPDTSTETGIGYTSYSLNAPKLAILFDENNCVKSYGILVYSSFTSQLSTFLTERYVYVGYANDIFMYMNGLTISSATIIVGLELYNTNYWMAVYVPNSSKSEINHTELKSLINTLFN